MKIVQQHPQDEVIQRKNHLDGFPHIPVPKRKQICSGCAKGKMRSKSFPESQSRASSPFDLIHSDLKEISMISYHKYKYFVTFIDDFSGHLWIGLLKKKSDTESSLKQFVALIKNKYGILPKKWRFDGGSEFNKSEKYLKDLGIEIQKSLPYTSQQNGRAERMNRTIWEKSQSLRFDACLPQSWWEFALEHAVYLYNRTPIARNKWQTPYFLIEKKKPNVSDLRVFGCQAYVYIPAERRQNKLEARSKMMIFLGYKNGMKGYKFMNPENNTIFMGTTGVFDETKFPKCRNSDLIPTFLNPEEEFEDLMPEIPHETSEEQNTSDKEEDSPKSDSDSNSSDESSISPKVKGSDDSDDDSESDDSDNSGSNSGSDNSDDQKEIEEDLFAPSRSPSPGPSRPIRNRQPVNRPDNVYGDKDPVEIEKMDRRTRLNRFTINKLLSCAIPIKETANTAVPEHHHEIFRLPINEQKDWINAEHKEWDMLIKRGVIINLQHLPQGRKAIGCRWVYVQKDDGRKKARLVAQGFSQIDGIDYDEIFSPVVRYETCRLILALAALEKLHVSFLDVTAAFLYGKLDEEIYMRQPPGFINKDKKDMVYKLYRALYGLKQASLAWWKSLDESMEKMGFIRINSDAGVFVFKQGSNIVIAIIYVDDSMFLGSNKTITLRKKQEFMNRWESRDLGDLIDGQTKNFLSFQIKKQGDKITIDQKPYLHKVIQRLGMSDATHINTPLPTGYEPMTNDQPLDHKIRSQYQSVIGSLLYLMIGTRPDICFAVIKMSQFSANPSSDHLKHAIGMARYLAKTADLYIKYDGSFRSGLMSYTDSDWASDKNDRHSTSGFFTLLSGGVVSWTSKKQKTVALSSTEAEYMALSDCARENKWIRSILSEIHFPINIAPIYGDNMGSLFIANNPVTEKRSKHIDIKYHFIRKLIKNKEIELRFIPGSENPADILTKNLGRILFEKFIPMLGLSESLN